MPLDTINNPDLLSIAAGKINDNDSYLQAQILAAAAEAWEHEQAGPALVWTITHNLGTELLAYTIVDPTGEEIHPKKFEVIDENSVEITFSIAEYGKAVLVFGKPADRGPLSLHLLNRANHFGTQSQSTVTGLQSAIGLINTKLQQRAETYAASFTATDPWIVTHNFGTEDVIVQVYDAATPRVMIQPSAYSVELTSDDTITITFTGGPTSGRVVILG